MKLKRILSLVLYSLLFVFVITSCKKKKDEPVIDYTLEDKSAIIGTHKGTVTISDAVTKKTTTFDAEVVFDKQDNTTLQCDLLGLKRGITAVNFKKSTDDTYYYFDMLTFSNFDFIGGEIPSYILEWYSYIQDKERATINSGSFSGIKYDKATATLSFTLAASFSIYQEGTSTSAANTTVTYMYTDLKKIK